MSTLKLDKHADKIDYNVNTVIKGVERILIESPEDEKYEDGLGKERERPHARSTVPEETNSLSRLDAPSTPVKKREKTPNRKHSKVIKRKTKPKDDSDSNDSDDSSSDNSSDESLSESEEDESLSESEEDELSSEDIELEDYYDKPITTKGMRRINDQLVELCEVRRKSKCKAAKEAANKSHNMQSSLIQLLPRYDRAYKTWCAYYKYFNDLESAYPGIINLLLGKTDLEGIHEDDFEYTGGRGDYNKVYAGYLVTELYLSLSMKLEISRHGRQKYECFQKELKSLVSVSYEHLGAIIQQTIVTSQKIHDVNISFITKPVKMLQEIQEQLITPEHEKVYWFLTLKPILGTYYKQFEKMKGETGWIDEIRSLYLEAMETPDYKKLMKILLRNEYSTGELLQEKIIRAANKNYFNINAENRIQAENLELRRTKKRVNKQDESQTQNKQNNVQDKHNNKKPKRRKNRYVVERKDYSNQKWREAMDKEIATFKAMKVYKVVEQPKDVTPITSRWVHTFKKDDLKGDVYNSRCVIHGFKQILDKHYDKYRVSSPVVDLTTIRLITAIANEFKWEIHHFHVSHAYLHAPIDFPNVYVEPPKGYELEQGQCWLLEKSVCGLKQAGYNWYHFIRKKLIELGFSADDLPGGVFLKPISGNKKIIVALYVDDLLITGPSPKDIQEIYEQLLSKVNLKTFNQVTEYSGIEFKKEEEQIKLHQTKFLRHLMKEFEIEKEHPEFTPLASQKKPKCEGFCPEKDERIPLNKKQTTKYQRGVGSLLWVSNNTRPDISYAVGKLGSAVNKPTNRDYENLIKCMCYVNRTMDQRLTISNDNFEHLPGQFFIEVFCDASFAEDKHAKLISGYVIYVNGNPIRWKSKRQTIMSSSTTESELIALMDAIEDALEIRQIIIDLGYEISNMTIFNDNQDAIEKCLNPKLNHHRRSIDVLMKFIREKVDQRYFNIEYINTKLNIADLLTKSHLRVGHNQLKEMLFKRDYEAQALAI